jgi:hypothetical protein
MTFEELKTEVLNKARQLEVCYGYQDALQSKDYSGLIISGLQVAEWLYGTGIITDDLLLEFPAIDLEASGVYVSGNYTVNDPAIPKLRLLSSVNADISITGNGRYEIYCGGTGEITINGSGNAYINITAENTALLTVNFTDNAHGMIRLTGRANLNYNGTQNASLHVINNSDTGILITAQNDSFVNIKGYGNSVTEYTLSAKATAITANYDNSIITNKSI